MDHPDFIFRVVVLTLAAAILSVVFALLAGLFDTHVDNAEIFKIIGPAFHEITGGFIGVLCGRYLASKPS